MLREILYSDLRTLLSIPASRLQYTAVKLSQAQLPSSMPGNRAYKEPLGHATWSSSAMRDAFGQICGGQRMLRGEQLFRTNKVLRLTTTTQHGYCIRCKVLSSDWRSNAPGGAYSVCVHFMPISDEQCRRASQILSSWDVGCAIMSQYGNQPAPPARDVAHRLAEPLIKALSGLPIVPQVCSKIASATCTCGDFTPDRWCKHVAAVGYQIIHWCEVDPFFPFTLRTLDVKPLSNGHQHKRRREPEVISLVDSEDEGSMDGSSVECAVKL